MEKSIEMKTDTGKLILTADEKEQWASVSFAPNGEKLVEKNHGCDIDVVYITLRDENDRSVYDRDCGTMSNIHVYAHGCTHINGNTTAHTVIETEYLDVSDSSSITEEEYRKLKQDITRIMCSMVSDEYAHRLLESKTNSSAGTLMDDIIKNVLSSPSWNKNHKYSDKDIHPAIGHALWKKDQSE